MDTFFWFMSAAYRRGFPGAYRFLHNRCVECGIVYHRCECYG